MKKLFTIVTLTLGLILSCGNGQTGNDPTLIFAGAGGVGNSPSTMNVRGGVGNVGSLFASHGGGAPSHIICGGTVGTPTIQA